MDWNETLPPSTLKQMAPHPSPMEALYIRDRIVYVKRDDQLQLQSGISGNKARKFLSLQAVSQEEFPSTLVSYGGPQSNSMLALAAVAHSKQSRFVYYTKHLPNFLKRHPTGNLFRAQSLGMELRELSAAVYQNKFGSFWGGSSEPPVGMEAPDADSLWIPQGGASTMATAGTAQLAAELVRDWGNKGPCAVCMPSGTGTTALLVHHALKELLSSSSDTMKVVVIPCVGDAAYTRRQMMHLNAQSGRDLQDVPEILEPFRTPFRFGEPHARILDTYRELKLDHNLVLDLLYGAPSFCTILDSIESTRLPSPLDDRIVLYVHSGGLEGISSQLARYRFKGLVDKDEVPLLG